MGIGMEYTQAHSKITMRYILWKLRNKEFHQYM